MAEDLEQRLRDGLEGVQGGPWHLDKHAVFIFAPSEKGGDFPLGDEVCGGRVMRLRGWGYYTGRGHGALALPEDEAVKRQRLTGEHIARCSPENIAALLEDLSTSRARVEALEKALEPFAAAAETYDPPEGDDQQLLWGPDFVTIGMLRDARAALSRQEEGNG